METAAFWVRIPLLFWPPLHKGATAIDLEADARCDLRIPVHDVDSRVVVGCVFCFGPAGRIACDDNPAPLAAIRAAITKVPRNVPGVVKYDESPPSGFSDFSGRELEKNLRNQFHN